MHSYALMLSYRYYYFVFKSEKGPSLSSSTNRDVLKKVGVP